MDLLTLTMTDIRSCYTKAVETLISLINEDGSLKLETDEPHDLCHYFKIPMAMIAAGKLELAKVVLSYIKKHFISSDGDVLTDIKGGLKSCQGHYVAYWTYCNGWVIMAANKMQDRALANLGVNYVQRYHLGEGCGFQTGKIGGGDASSDVLTTSNCGKLALEVGNMELAHSAAKYLLSVLDKQADYREKGRFYLRFDADLNRINPSGREGEMPGIFYSINLREKDQLYFMIGYPVGYLATLYGATKRHEYLDGARRYLEVFETCLASGAARCKFSHKEAWGAAVLYNVTREERYLKICAEIMQHLASTQSGSGLWEIEDRNAVYDQTAEISYWMMEIESNLLHSASS